MNPESRAHGQQVTPGTELNLQLLHRAYCYLRLCGVDAPTALQGMRASMNVLADAVEGDGGQAIWRQLETLTSQNTELVPSTPPLLRGHIGYPVKGR